MLTVLVKCVSGAVFLGSLFWCPSGDCVALLLAVWTIAIAVFACSNLAERFLWVPILLALAGVFGLIFLLAIPDNITLAAEEAMLVMFAVSLALLKKKPRAPARLLRLSGSAAEQVNCRISGPSEPWLWRLLLRGFWVWRSSRAS